MSKTRAQNAQYQREYRQRNLEKMRAYGRKRYNDNKEYYARWHIKDTYGLTPDEVDDMLHKQRGLCKLCRKPMKRINVDHCHKTGCIRGLVCRNCNFAIGCFNDDPALMRRAARHVEQCRS
jgi:hypothetical protein